MQHIPGYYHQTARSSTPPDDLLAELRRAKQNRNVSVEERARIAAEHIKSTEENIKDLLARTNNTDRVEQMKEASEYVSWKECVDSVTEADIASWADWRKRDVSSIEAFVAEGLYGAFKGQFASPIYQLGTPNFIGIHAHSLDLNGKKWFIRPGKTPQQPLILGQDHTEAEYIFIGESQWDLDRLISELGWLKQDEGWCTICTRGGKNATLCPTDLFKDATIFALAHADEPGELWLSELGMHLGRRMHILRPPFNFVELDRQWNDIDDWFRLTFDDKIENPCKATKERLTELIQDIEAGEPELPRFILGGVSREKAFEQLYTYLAKTQRFFYRCGEYVTLRADMESKYTDKEYLHSVTNPYGTHGDIAGYVETYGWKVEIDKTAKQVVKRLVPYKAPVEDAKFFLQSPQIKHSLKLRLLSASPILTEKDGEPVMLGKGYHSETGGVFIENDVPIDYSMELEDAVKILTDGIELGEGKPRIGGLFANYTFVHPSDYSRAVAQVLSPMMKLGLLLGPEVDFPIDLSMADKSQSGKSHRLRFTTLLYDESAYTITQKTGGVGSLDETFATALVAGRLFIMIDNIRGGIDSKLIESYIRGSGKVSVRIPYHASAVVSVKNSLLQMTTNDMTTLSDMSNRSVIVDIRKNPEGFVSPLPRGPEQLAYIEQNRPMYLSAIVRVLSEWIKKGKPQTDEKRHEFKEWTRALDWIVQNIFHMQPLMEDHEGLQELIGDVNQNFIRKWANFILDQGKLGVSFRAVEIQNHCIEAQIVIPNVRPGADDTARAKQVGVVMQPVFSSAAYPLEDGRTKRWKCEDLYIYRTEWAPKGASTALGKYYTVHRIEDDMPEPDIEITRSKETIASDAFANKPNLKKAPSAK